MTRSIVRPCLFSTPVKAFTIAAFVGLTAATTHANPNLHKYGGTESEAMIVDDSTSAKLSFEDFTSASDSISRLGASSFDLAGGSLLTAGEQKDTMLMGRIGEALDPSESSDNNGHRHNHGGSGGNGGHDGNNGNGGGIGSSDPGPSVPDSGATATMLLASLGFLGAAARRFTRDSA
jgi:hypothetical protein